MVRFGGGTKRGLIQRPFNWIITAVGIVVGDAPDVLDPNVVPALDVMQGGMGQAVWTEKRVDGSLASTTNDQFVVGDDRYAHIVRCEFQNLGSTAITFRVRCWKTSTVQHLIIATVAAGGEWAPYGSSALAIHPGVGFMFIPPGYNASVVMNQFVTAAGFVTLQYARVPAGTKPF